MTAFWELQVNCPADLAPLADSLEEAGAREWAGSVRRLIAEGRWPRRFNLWFNSSRMRTAWGWGDAGSVLPQARSNRWRLPSEMAIVFSGARFDSALAAVWAVIHSGLYRGTP